MPVVHSLVASLAIPIALTLSSPKIVGGNPLTATIALAAPAPAGGVEVTLTSSNNSVAQFGGRLAPAIGTSQLTIAAGSVSATFPVRTFGVAAPTTVTLKAAVLGGTGTATLTVVPASILSLTAAPASPIGGTGVTGTITLDGAAPPGGATVTVRPALASGPATFPATVTVPANATSTSFAIATTPVGRQTTVSFDAALGASGTPTSATFTLLPPTIGALLVLPPTVVGGGAATARVKLTGKAPLGGFPVSLTSSGAAASVPSTALVPAGTDQVDAPVATTPVPTTQTITLRAARGTTTGGITTTLVDGSSNTVQVGETAPSPGTATATLSVTPPPPPLASFTVRPTTVTGGLNAIATLTASSGVTAPVTVSLTSDHPQLVTVPATTTVPVPPQVRSLTFTTAATTSPVTVTVTATAGAQSITTTLTVVP
jgi:hypothetical protein